MTRVAALLAVAGVLALAGCAAPAEDAVALCEQQMAESLEASADGSASEWAGGRVDDRVFEYTAVLTVGGDKLDVSCLVATTPDGLLLQDFDADER